MDERLKAALDFSLTLAEKFDSPAQEPAARLKHKTHLGATFSAVQARRHLLVDYLVLISFHLLTLTKHFILQVVAQLILPISGD